MHVCVYVWCHILQFFCMLLRRQNSCWPLLSLSTKQVALLLGETVIGHEELA